MATQIGKAKRIETVAKKPSVARAEIVDKTTRARFPAASQIGETCRDACIEQGLVMRHVRDSMIVAPPLVITKPQLDELVDKARRSLDITARRIAK